MITSATNTMTQFIHYNARVLYMDTLVIPYNQITNMSITYNLIAANLTVTTHTGSYIQELRFDTYARYPREIFEYDFYQAMDNWRSESMWANAEKINEKQ